MSRRLSIEEVQHKINKVHGNEEYTIISEYESYSKHIIVRHNKCNYKWKVVPSSIINLKTKCPNCSNHIRTQWNEELFSKKVIEMSNGEYILYSDFKTVNDIVDIKHLKCGRVKTLIAKNVLNGFYKCDMCKMKGNEQRKNNDIESKWEKRIREYLLNNNINFISQYRTDGCKYKNKLPFDFAILNNKNNIFAMIEYDGEQHYKPIFGDLYDKEYIFIEQKKRDKIKENYCFENDIYLVRIPFTQYENIEEILNRFFRVHKII